MKIELAAKSQLKQNQDTLVVFYSVALAKAGTSKKKNSKRSADKEATKGQLVTRALPSEVEEMLQKLFKEDRLGRSAGEGTLFRECELGGARHLITMPIKSENLEAEDIRRASAAILAQLKSTGSERCEIWLDTAGIPKKLQTSCLQALTEGLYLSSYEFTELKKQPESAKKDRDLKNLSLVTKLATDSSAKKAFQRGQILAESVNFARRLGDLPGNLMTPRILAEEAKNAAKGTKMKVTIWDKARIKKEKMGGLLGVSQGSAEEPRFIIMEYKGAAASKAPLIFVGKGLTFDTGGHSLKPSPSMEEMKYDMCGGANVIGTLRAIALLGLKINVIGLIPASENLPGPTATKPGDVHVARNGVSFEVNNTDAEGRLILADALCYASELRPKAIFDVATLTGAIIMALGNIHTGVFTRSKDLARQIEQAAEKSGELLWNMPLTDFHSKDMKGTYADLSNISSSKGAGSATAAAFLEYFVEKDIPWAHFDIAGTAWNTGSRLPYCPKKGASGCMIRTFVELAEATF